MTARRQKKVLGVLCAAILVGILTAGLWPFHSPKNEVSWSSNGNGLRFGRNGLILSADTFGSAALKEESPCSLEIWVQPEFGDIGGTILAFYRPESRIVTFSVHQSIDDLFLRRVTIYGQHRAKNKFYVEQLFRTNKQLFITISSNTQSTSVYVNGVLAHRSPMFGLSSKDLTGQLVVGNHPLVDNGWQGQLKGLAIYGRELTAAEVLQRYQDWTTNQRADIENENPAALYLFNEGMGNVAHNPMNSETNLRIPERYFVVHPPFLQLPWDEFQPSWSYSRDILVNIGGFVPFGFFFCAYFVQVRGVHRAVLATVVLGGVVSLTIEVLQAFLPTRDSGMTDIITNTLGTAMGAMLYSSQPVQALFARVGLGGRQRRPLLYPRPGG
jgi:VanZ like family/Concanavalin A-like lectin/glucanases superfamily